MREVNMNQDRMTSERGDNGGNLAPRVVYDSALAGDLRHARDGGLHDWVTNPPPPPPPPGPHVHPPWQHQLGGDGGGDARPQQQQQGPSSAITAENYFRPLHLPPLRLEQGTPSAELRTSTLTQAIRRHSRMSGRTPRTGLESYVLDRARRVEEGESEPSSRHTARLVRPPSMIQPSERRQGIPNAELRASMDTYRQRYLQNPSSVSVDGGGPLEQAIRYLERVRDPQPGDGDILAMCARYFTDLADVDPETGKDVHDVVVDSRSIRGPAETSWLRIGSVFEGTQHAAGIPNSLRRRLSSHLAGGSNNNNNESRGTTPDAATGPRGVVPSSALADNHVSLRYLMDSQCCCVGDLDGAEHFDKWPVKVTIHSIDYETMQLAGEMEAFDVPDRTAPECKSSITTFLEGEIIDLTHHTLETKNYRSSVRIDSIYWQKLLPFRGHDEREVCHWLLSRRWLEEHLSKEWILMRWKGMYLAILPSHSIHSTALLPLH